jgi:ribosomal protein S18 acetylase RimI-like enzyme
MYEVEPLSLDSDTIENILSICYRAFDSDTLYDWLYRNQKQRELLFKEHLKSYFNQAILWKKSGKQTLYGIKDRDKIIAFTLFIPPSCDWNLDQFKNDFKIHDQLCDKLESQESIRVKQRYQVFEKLYENFPPESNNDYYLMLLACDPDSKGLGLGTKLLKFCVNQANREKTGIVLDTSSYELIKYYQKHGFRNIKTYQMIDNSQDIIAIMYKSYVYSDKYCRSAMLEKMKQYLLQNTGIT